MSAPAVGKRSRVSRVETDFNHLLDRIHKRNYVDTLPTLCLYWLKTAYMAGYGRGDWAELDRLLASRIAQDGAETPSGSALTTLRNLLRDQELLSGGAPPPPPRSWLTNGGCPASPDA